ncbi:Valyl/Leucyl/Isoleucyl-tRNA synthetase [Fomitopsis serialis]|uniref:Valyl/Leucyl/Isoleucyl-tRNA synthetase n=1 Tax=Fomitopsis serialis TaxID=139415 RepID=UPI00200783AE|nr:Valyl/Leucyl/Isoleucyl-tRNA synthetase [Neoantrodia serialis]KAH9923231.1 Valyl/Leucyl/Isoleucyl-tRNA synthetase [Neoantrodia serialis]
MALVCMREAHLRVGFERHGLVCVRKVHPLVWTTIPWTVTANMGIAVNPEMMHKAVAESEDPTASVDIFAVERETGLVDILGTTNSNVPVVEFPGLGLVGATYRPLFSTLSDAESVKSLPVVPSSHATPNTRTGLVHCAPAHGDEDYNAFRSVGHLSSTSDASSGDLLYHVDVTGRFTKGVADVGHKAAKGLVGHATSQWFANADHIKDDALWARTSPASSQTAYEKPDVRLVVTIVQIDPVYAGYIKRNICKLHGNLAAHLWPGKLF